LRKIDLHTHTNASDGALSPVELVRLARERGLDVIAVTDHDTTAGIEEALAEGKALGLQVIPGIEMSADVPGAEVHIAGYFIDYKSPDLQNTLSILRQARVGRARAMVEKLAQLGVSLAWERVLELAGTGSVGRPHIALAMLEKGHVATTGEAFARYLSRNGPAYVERYKLKPAEAVKFIRANAGLAALAHPIVEVYGGILGKSLNLDELLPELCAAGLAAMEVYYTGYTQEMIEQLLQVTNRYGLIPTGGSDFHGGAVLPQAVLGSISVPESSLEQLQGLLAKQQVSPRGHRP